MGDNRSMNRVIGYGIGVMIIIIGISAPVYGKENALTGQGNMKGIDEQLKNMESDYNYLENEILKLFEECE